MAGTTPGSLRRRTRAAEAQTQLLFVLDSSGSMQEETAGGEVGIAAAKTAMDTAVGQIPADTAVGLRVFGAKVFNRGDEGACTDSQLVVPSRRVRRRRCGRRSRTTPLRRDAHQLRAGAAAGDLGGGDGKRTTVLSDGESTCEPDPCEVAGQITKADKNLRIDVAGLDLRGEARDQMRCVASRGRGTCHDARNSETLASSLQTLRNRAARPFEVSGEPVVGGRRPSSPPC